MYQMLEEMPQSELVMWAKYLQARPIGWREDSRAAMLMQSQGAKVKAKNIFPSIAQMDQWEQDRSDEEKSNQTLRKSIFGAMIEQSINKTKEQRDGLKTKH